MKNKNRIILNALRFVAVSILATMLWLAVFGSNGFKDLIQKRQIVEKYESQLDEVRSQNEQLRAEIIALKTNSKKSVEKLARRNLSFVGDDEVVYIFNEQETRRSGLKAK